MGVSYVLMVVVDVGAAAAPAGHGVAGVPDMAQAWTGGDLQSGIGGLYASCRVCDLYCPCLWLRCP